MQALHFVPYRSLPSCSGRRRGAVQISHTALSVVSYWASIREERKAARKQTAEVSKARQGWGMVGKPTTGLLFP